jgi:hypothetical protein
MLRAKIAIKRTPEGLWKAEGSSIQIDATRQIGLSRMRPEETLADLVETIMGDALLALDKNGRRGTSEPIQWEITVDGVPHCYRCVEPMLKTATPSDASKAIGGTTWKCDSCGVMVELGS